MRRLANAESSFKWAVTLIRGGVRLNGTGVVNSYQNRWELQDKEKVSTFNLNRVNFGARVYNPTIGRWDRVDALADHPNQIDKSPYAAFWNNPANLNDPDGNCPICPVVWAAFEIGGAIYDGYQAYKTLSDQNATKGEKWEAAGGVALGALLPGAGYGTAAKITAKVVDKAVDVGKAADKAVDTKNVVAKTNDAKDLLKQGRSGKQERLKELANDPKTSSSDGGWIKQDMNEIAKGKRQNIRNPPGKDLAHERGKEAAKGYRPS